MRLYKHGKVLLEQVEEPLKPIIERLFEFLNEEKKTHKTKPALLQAIKDILPYFSIPEGYALYILELYLLNYNEEGDYSGLNKGNFIDPRDQRGKTTSNTKANLYTIAKLPFRGSNLDGYWDENTNGEKYYVVTSYRWYPVYLFKDGVWYEVNAPYSSSTSRQMNNAFPSSQRKWNQDLEIRTMVVTPDEMKKIMRGMTLDELKKSKIKNLENASDELKKRRTGRLSSWGGNGGRFFIKYKIKDIRFENEKAIVDIDVKLESPERIEDSKKWLNRKLNTIFSDYLGPYLRWGEGPKEENLVQYNFNFLPND